MHANGLKIVLFVWRRMKIEEFGKMCYMLTSFPSKTVLTLHLPVFPWQLAICLTLWCWKLWFLHVCTNIECGEIQTPGTERGCVRVCSVLEISHCFRHSLKEHYQLFQFLKNINSLLNIVFLRNCLLFLGVFFCLWLGKWLCRENLGNFV